MQGTRDLILDQGMKHSKVTAWDTLPAGLHSDSHIVFRPGETNQEVFSCLTAVVFAQHRHLPCPRICCLLASIFAQQERLSINFGESTGRKMCVKLQKQDFFLRP